MDAPHPFYPLEAEIVGYSVNESSVFYLLLTASFACTILFVLTYAGAKWQNPLLQRYDIAIIFWFVLSGCLHLFFEGYYVLHHQKLVGLQSYFGQLWKDYALSDSRYLTQEPFLLCMETFTVCTLGPLCFFTALLSTLSHPMRYSLQLIVSIGHIYSDILYFMTSTYAHFYQGVSYSRPEAIYFWGYYVFLNALWIVVPAYLIYDNTKQIAEAVRVSDKIRRTSKVKNT